MIWWKEPVSGFFDHLNTRIGLVKTRPIKETRLSFAQAQVLQKSIARANDIVSAGAGKSYLVYIPFLLGFLTRQLRHL